MNLENTENHKVVEIKDIGKETEEFDFKNVKCHTGHKCVKFCKSCDKLVCPLCINKIHHNHTLVGIRDACKRKISKLKTSFGVLYNEEVKIQKLRKDEISKYTKVKNQIQEHNLSLKKAIDKCTEKLLSELNENRETLLNSLKEAKNRVILLKKNVTDKMRHMEKIINSNNIEPIFEDSKKLEESLTEALNLVFTSAPVFEPGEKIQCNIGTLTHITLQVIKEYTTDISRVFYISPCVNSLWITDQKVVQKVQPEVNNLKVIINFDAKISGMAVTPSNDVLLAQKSGSILKQISISTNKLTYTNYSVDPLGFSAVHVTSDYKVIVGVMNFGKAFPVIGRRAVIMMDKEGIHKTIYEYDRNNQPIFTYVRRITSTNNGNICVVDKLSSDDRGRVVVLGQGGDIINIYTGHPDVNTKDNPFKCSSIVTTPSDNIIVPDFNIGVLHILNNVGQLITHINTREIGLLPYSLAFTSTGHVYIGCTSYLGSTKLYEVKLSGC